MEKDTRYMQDIAEGYREDVLRLVSFLPWLESKMNHKVSGLYKGEGIEEHSMVFPVYDGQLIAFVKEVKKTSLLDRNYVYLYSRNRIKTSEDEKQLVEKATIRELDAIRGVLSKYILGGMTDTKKWPEGVENGIYLDIIHKLREIIEFWSGPVMPEEK